MKKKFATDAGVGWIPTLNTTTTTTTITTTNDAFGTEGLQDRGRL